MKEWDNNHPLVSVVIPIYNVAQHIDKGLQNILRQDYPNFEIILVDDGSTDNSGALCDAWAEKESCIRVFHKQNEGAGSARNVGILQGKGKYIYFFDIDDEADTDLLSYNVGVMEEKGVDYILFGFRTITPFLNNLQDEVCFEEREIHSNEELKSIYVDIFVLTKHGNGFPWNKFYRRSFLMENNLLFENQRIQQDEVFNLNLYPHLEKAYISSRIYYTYYIYNKGNTRVRFIPDRFDIYVSVREHFEHLLKHWGLNDVRMQQFLDKRFLNGIIQCCVYNLFHRNCTWTHAEKKQEIRRIVEHPYTQLVLSKDWSLSIESKIYLSCIKHQNVFALQIACKVFNSMHALKTKIK